MSSSEITPGGLGSILNDNKTSKTTNRPLEIYIATCKHFAPTLKENLSVQCFRYVPTTERKIWRCSHSHDRHNLVQDKQINDLDSTGHSNIILH
ncbi:hypothetical protein GDO81_012285 [Engystomops pustulosus]|uniref:Uncharacterized protein n=1 Tax=Engystomops pustulosus TaxID=76066 RepID=A0AAV7BKT7_ENGPU|nr:hypothetical protein GDO81_012285 [Engystomops pustulosus]